MQFEKVGVTNEAEFNSLSVTERANWRRGFLDEHRVYRAGNDLRRSAWQRSTSARILAICGASARESSGETSDSPTLRFAHPPSNGRAKIPAALLRSDEGGNEKGEGRGSREAGPGVPGRNPATGPFSCRIPSIARHCHAIRVGKRKTNYFALAVLSVIPAEYTTFPCFYAGKRDNLVPLAYLLRVVRV